MKKAMDTTALKNRIGKKPTIDKFTRADEVLGTTEEIPKERAIRKSYTIIQIDLDRLKEIRKRCLNEKAVLQESHIIRIGIMLAHKLPTSELIEAFEQISIIPVGRPKK